jgi:S-formylglutathione hydrolase FrmB
MSPGRPSRGQIKRRRRVAAGLLVAVVIAVAYVGLSATVFAPVDTHGAQVAHLTIHSNAVDRDLDVGVVVPGGDTESKRPLLVFLHGKDETAGDFVGDGPLSGDEPFFAALAKLGAKAPIVAFPEDDGDSYWHDRASGDWGTYVMKEVIPEVPRRFGADSHRVAVGGISMGGFGAYELALQHPSRFCAVGGHSPALWLRGADTAPGAFDDAEDFERHDVIATVRNDPGAFGPIPIWNDYGSEDPFAISDVALDETLEAAGADVQAHSWPGPHDRGYWDRHWNSYLRFYAAALARCGEAATA